MRLGARNYSGAILVWVISSISRTNARLNERDKDNFGGLAKFDAKKQEYVQQITTEDIHENYLGHQQYQSTPNTTFEPLHVQIYSIPLHASVSQV